MMLGSVVGIYYFSCKSVNLWNIYYYVVHGMYTQINNMNSNNHYYKYTGKKYTQHGVSCKLCSILLSRKQYFSTQRIHHQVNITAVIVVDADPLVGIVDCSFPFHSTPTFSLFRVLSTQRSVSRLYEIGSIRMVCPWDQHFGFLPSTFLNSTQKLMKIDVFCISNHWPLLIQKL